MLILVLHTIVSIGIVPTKKEKSLLLAKISTDIFYTRSEIKNEFFISLARLIIKFEPTPIVETSFHYGAGIFIRLAP